MCFRAFSNGSILVAAFCFTALPGHAASTLQPPFDIRSQRAIFGAPLARFACPSPPPPVRNLLFEGFYADRGENSSVVDPEARRRYEETVQPISQFEKFISESSDLYVRSNPPKREVAQCVLGWLAAWAEGNAMLGKISQQGGYARKWSLATVATSYVKVRGGPMIEAGKGVGSPRSKTPDPLERKIMKDVVASWIGRWASLVRDDYSTGLQRASRRNNHLYWAAWSAIAAAVVLDDRELFRWGIERYRFALAQIQDDGTLPLELKRKSKALHYHFFSIAPLVLIAESGARNGIDLYAERGGTLHRLIRRSVEALDNPGFFERATGHTQDWVGQLSGDKLAWMEPYHARFPDPALEKWILRFRPLKNRRLGGDTTLLYAPEKQP